MEQYGTLQNSTKDIDIHSNTLDTLQNNLIYYNRSNTKQHNEQQHNTKGNTKDMAKNTVITLRISEELQATIQAIASKEETPASYIIRRLIKAGLHAEGKHLASQVKTTQIPDWE
jgi:predicted DNA binding CopG/RHH family protein